MAFHYMVPIRQGMEIQVASQNDNSEDKIKERKLYYSILLAPSLHYTTLTLPR